MRAVGSRLAVGARGVRLNILMLVLYYHAIFCALFKEQTQSLTKGRLFVPTRPHLSWEAAFGAVIKSEEKADETHH